MQTAQMIADILSIKINEICATKKDLFFTNFICWPTDDEVYALFILSSCLDVKMKKFLLSEVGSAVIR
jgi:hypothetical protein